MAADRLGGGHGEGAKLAPSLRLFYGLGTIAFGVKDNGFTVFLLIFYNQVLGLPAATVGGAIMAALALDAFIDPVIGQLSDNWRSRWGRRHPFMYASALPVAASYLLLWNPPAHLPPAALTAWLTVTAVLIRSFISLYEIPSAALAAELTDDYDERTSLASHRYLFGWLGGLFIAWLAIAVFLKGGAAGQLQAQGYARYGLAAAALMAASILASAIGTHRAIPRLRAPPHHNLKAGRLARELLGTLAHGSFLMILVASVFNAMAIGLFFSLNLYFQTFFWGLTSGQIAAFMGANLIAAFAAFYAAPWMSRRWGKKPAAIATLALSLVTTGAPIALRLAGLLPANGAAGLFALLFAQNVAATGLSIVSQILMSAMIADVVDDSELRTGRRQEGVFFAAQAFVNKAVSGVGIFAAGMVLSLAHFPAAAQPGEVAETVNRALALAYLPAFSGLTLAAVLCLAGYRISRASHQAALEALAARAQTDVAARR